MTINLHIIFSDPEGGVRKNGEKLGYQEDLIRTGVNDGEKRAMVDNFAAVGTAAHPFYRCDKSVL